MSDFPNAPDVGSQFNQVAPKPEIQSSPAHVQETFTHAAATPTVHVEQSKPQLNYDMPGPMGNEARQKAQLEALPQKAQLSINTDATRALQRKIDRDKIKLQKAKEFQREFNQHSRGG